MTGAENTLFDWACDLLKILGNPLNPRLYFIVPLDRFSSFTCQRYNGTDGHVLSLKGIVSNVQKRPQFVLTFEISYR